MTRPQTAINKTKKKKLVEENPAENIKHVFASPKKKKSKKPGVRSSKHTPKSRSRARSPFKEAPLEDNGILSIKVGRKGHNEYVKPGHKKYNAKGTSYTNEVLERLDQIKNPMPPKGANLKRPKTGKKTKG